MLHKFEKWLEINDLSKKAYLNSVKQLLKYADGREITPEIVYEFLNQLDQKKTSKLRHLYAIREYYEFINLDKLDVPEFPFKRISKKLRLGGTKEREIRVLSEEEIHKGFLNSNIETQPIIITLFDLALRRGELLRLRTSDFDLGKRLVNIRSEKKRRETIDVIPFNDITFDVLDDWLEYQNLSWFEDAVIFSIDPTTVWRRVKKVLGVHPQILRHSRATQYYRKTKSLEETAIFLRHSFKTRAFAYGLPAVTPEYIHEERIPQRVPIFDF